MTRRTQMNLNQWTLYAALATGALLLTGAGAHASSKAKTFEQAVVEAHQSDLHCDVKITTSLPHAVLKHRLGLLIGANWTLRDVSAA